MKYVGGYLATASLIITTSTAFLTNQLDDVNVIAMGLRINALDELVSQRVGEHEAKRSI